MVFTLKQIKGHGRGRTIGFPTINLDVPTDLILDDGIYAAWVVINNKTYKGALHYGPVPTFDEKDKSLEVYLLDVNDDNVPETQNTLIEVDIVEFVRGIKRFLDSDSLAEQIDRDVLAVNSILS